MSDKEARGSVSPGQEAATDPSRPGTPQLDWQIVEISDVGRLRPHNEDYVAHRVPSDPSELESKGALLLVADGMGGHQAGEVASEKAVEEVTAQYYADSSHNVGTSLVRAFRAANLDIYSQAQADPSKAGMGTTLVVAALLGRKVYVANVGDSRAYLINENGISQITEDHSWVEEQVRAGLLDAEQAARHPQRNLLTRALGSKPAVDVDVFEGELGDKDSLLLCTDGLTGRLDDAEIAAIVQEHPPEEAARLLIAGANERGGNDNITVLLVSNRREAATVVVPKSAQDEKKDASSLPLVPILGAVAGLLVLALIALLVAPMLLGGRATETPIPTMSAAAPTAPSTIGTARVEPTVDVTGTPAVVAPTATLVPTPTQATSPTVSGVMTSPLPVETPLATPGTTEASAPAPVLLGPMEGFVATGVVTFSWDYGSLPEGSEFRILMAKGRDTAPGDPIGTTDVSSLSIDLAQVSQIVEGGAAEYSWTVDVVDIETGASIGPAAVARHLIWSGPQPASPGPTQAPISATP